MRRFAELTVAEVQQQVSETSTLVLPFGAIEQHGPHLPLDTDLVIAEATAAALIDRVGEELDLWLLPALPYTKSDEHHRFPGTMWLSASTMLAVLDDLGRSVAATGARRLVFVNGHGGNSALLRVALRELRRRHGLDTFLVHPALPVDQGGTSPAGELGMGVHGGHEETSLLLHLRPESVRMELAERHVPEHLADHDHVRFGGSVAFGWTADDFGPSGVIGDPTTATAADGATLFGTIVDRFVEAFTEIVTFRLSDDPPPH